MSGIALLDMQVQPDVSLGFLYLTPLVVYASVASPTSTTVVALVCATLREYFSPLAFQQGSGARIILVTVVFAATALLVQQVNQNRRLISQRAAERQIAADRLQALIETSPLAIITTSADGNILTSNQSARSLLGLADNVVESVTDYVAVLKNPLDRASQMVGRQNHLEWRGTNKNGEFFIASVWFSVYAGEEGPEMTIVIWDTSEDLRTREWASRDLLMNASRVLTGALAHEVRNLAAAASNIHTGLGERHELEDDADFKALGSLVTALQNMASSGLKAAIREPTVVDLRGVLEELRIILTPVAEDSGVWLRWEVPAGLPRVRCDRSTLLQACLNLANNAVRAMEGSPEKQLRIRAATQRETVLVRFQDTGPGIHNPDRLFRPLQAGAEGTGLGLYLSRSLLAAAGGDLRLETQPSGTCFVVELPREDPAN